jgi:hypothetical protein
MRLFLVAFVSLLSCSVMAEGESSGSDWKFGLGAGYSPNHIATIKGTVSSSGGTTSNVDLVLEYRTAGEASVHLWYAPKDSWGFISGFIYGAERAFNKGTINGIQMSPTSTVSKYQTHYAYLGTAYRWSSFYLPFAITYGITKFTPADDSVVETKNGAGAMLGLGWFIGEHVAIEYVGRSSTTELKSTSSGGSFETTGMIASAALTLKFFY